MNIKDLPIEALQPNDWNPNSMPTDDLKAMVARFQANKGVDKPATVRVLSPDVYQLLDGEQTWRAAKLAHLATLPCIVVEMDDTQALATTFVKNLHGVLSPVIVGRNILRMKELSSEAGKPLTNGHVAKLMSKSEGTIRNFLIYAEAMAWVGKVEGYPSETEIAAMQVREVRALVEQMQAGGGGDFAKQQALPINTAEGKPVAEAMADEEASLKTMDKAYKAIKGLNLEQLRLLKNKVNALIREANKAEKAADGHTEAEEGGEALAA